MANRENGRPALSRCCRSLAFHPSSPPGSDTDRIGLVEPLQAGREDGGVLATRPGVLSLVVVEQVGGVQRQRDAFAQAIVERQGGGLADRRIGELRLSAGGEGADQVFAVPGV